MLNYGKIDAAANILNVCLKQHFCLPEILFTEWQTKISDWSQRQQWQQQRRWPHIRQVSSIGMEIINW